MSMAVNNSVMCNQHACNRPNFKGAEKSDASAPKRSWGKAIASGLCPGLGQALDDRMGTGAKHFGAFVGLAVLSKICAVSGVAAMAKNSKAGAIASIVAGTLAGIGSFGAWVHSVIDAYKAQNA